MTQKLASLSVEFSANLAKYEADMGRAVRIAKRESAKIKRQIASEMKSVATVMTGVGAAIIASSAKFAQFEQSMKNVGAVSGATEKELKQLTDTALKFAASTRFNPSQTTDALYSLSSAGQSVNEQISTLPNVLNLAEAASADLGQTTELLVSSMAQFGISADDSQRVADVFTASIANSATNVDRLQVAMRNAGAIAPAFNQGFEQTIAAVSILTTSFGNGEKAGTGFASALDQLAKNGNKLGLNVLNSAGEMKPFVEILEDIEKQGIKADEIIKVLGKDGGVGLATLLKQGSTALREMESSLQSNGQAAVTASKQLDTLKGDYDQLVSALDVFIIKMAKTNSENSNARELIQSLTKVVNSLAENIDSIIGGISLLVKGFVALKVARIAAGSVNLLGLNLLMTSKAMETATIRATALKGALAFVGGPVGAAVIAGFAIKELSDRYAIFNTKTRATIDIINNVNEALGKKINTSNIAEIENKYRSARVELEKLNKELEKAVIRDRIGLRSKRTPNDAKEVQENIDRLNLQINISETLDTTINSVISTYDKYSKILKNGVSKAVDEVNKKSVVLQKTQEQLDKESKARKKILEDEIRAYKQLGSEYESAINGLLTPLESLEQKYNDQIKAIEDWQNANIGNFEIWQKGNEFMDRAKKAYEDGTKAIEDNKKATEEQITPYEDLIQSMKDELMLLGLKGDALRGAQAAQFLATQGVTLASEGMEEYLKKLKEYLLLLERINNANSVPSFSQKLDGISGMISSLDRMHDAFQSMGRDFGKGIEGLANGFKGALQGLGSILGKDLLGGKGGTALQVIEIAGQVASFIDSITGGRLFGTDFEQESASTNINIGSSGASGTQSVTNVRQRSWFRGREWETTTEDMEAAALSALNAFYDGLIGGIDDLSRRFGIEAPSLIAGAFEENFDENGELVSQFSTILGRTFNETLQQFQLRLASENFIAVGDLGLGGGSEVSLFGEMYRDSAEQLAEYAEFAIDAVEQIISGDALLGSFTQLATIVEDLAQSNETLLQAHQRIKGSTDLFSEALDIMGISLITNQEQFIRFATSITDAAGGLENATSLWQSYFNTFYDSQELLNTQLAGSTALRDSLISGLGGDVNIDNFRDIFESLLPTLSADAIVQWLEAADAIGVVIDLESQLANQRQELTDILSSIEEYNATQGLSDFALEMREIQQRLNEQIATAIRLGATEKELAMIRNYADRQFRDTIRNYEQLAQQLSNDIYGSITDNLINGLDSQLSSVGEQISLLEQQQQAAQAAADAAIQAYNAQQQALESIAAFAESLLTGQFSPLNPAEQLAIAQSQFDEAVARANAGDVDAGLIQSLAQTLLGLGQTNFASGQANTDIFNSVYDALSALGLTAGAQQSTGGTVGVPSGLQNLYDLQAQLQQQLADAQLAAQQAETLLQQEQLLQMLRELSEAQNISIQELAERLGVPLEQLFDDLGISLYELNTNLSKPLEIDTSTINDNDTIVADAITTEGGETQEEIRTLREEVSGLRSDMREFMAQVAA